MKKAILFVVLVVFLAMLACGASGGSGSKPSSPPKLTILSVSQGKSTHGRTEATIEIRNDSGQAVQGVRVHADCYKGGAAVASEWMPTDPYDLQAGQQVVTSVRFAEGVTCDEIKARATSYR